MAKGMVDQFLTSEASDERKDQFRIWIETVRESATSNNEGVREISVLNGAATANYRIALLPNQRWAVSVQCSYNCGNLSGVGTPWTECPSREDCVAFFLKIARKHFLSPCPRDDSSLQYMAQKEMKRRLTDGLFGFIEPTPRQDHV